MRIVALFLTLLVLKLKIHLKRDFWNNRFWNSAYAVVSAGGHASIEQLLPDVRDQDSPA